LIGDIFVGSEVFIQGDGINYILGIILKIINTKWNNNIYQLEYIYMK